MICCNLMFLIVLGSIGEAIAKSDQSKIYFFHGSTPDGKSIYELEEAKGIINHPKFNLNRKTVFYIHGYFEKISSPTVVSIINAYIKRGTHNLLLLDWSNSVNGLYPIAVRNSRQLGPDVADVIINLFYKGVQINLFHIVGHSLGAHLAGHIGRTITKTSKQRIKLQRISGLDPAFPQYYPSFGGSSPISKKDAFFVDIIHTDGGFYGTPVSTGTVDFWPNGGRRIQPGCPNELFLPLSNEDFCSHHRSVAFWAESVSNSSSTFYATQSGKKAREKLMKIQMGINCSIK